MKVPWGCHCSLCLTKDSPLTKTSTEWFFLVVINGFGVLGSIPCEKHVTMLINLVKEFDRTREVHIQFLKQEVIHLLSMTSWVFKDDRSRLDLNVHIHTKYKVQDSEKMSQLTLTDTVYDSFPFSGICPVSDRLLRWDTRLLGLNPFYPHHVFYSSAFSTTWFIVLTQHLLS